MNQPSMEEKDTHYGQVNIKHPVKAWKVTKSLQKSAMFYLNVIQIYKVDPDHWKDFYLSIEPVVSNPC